MSETGCYIQFGNISWLSSALPFSSVENQEDYTDAVREYARNNIRDFSIVFASDFFNELLSDPEEMRLLRMSGMIDLCSTLTNDSFCYVRYSDVSFFEGLSVFCSSEEEFLSAFQQIRDGSEKYEGYSSFRFVLTESLYGRLMSHDHELLTEMEKNAGLTSYEQCSYSNSNFTVTYYAPEFYAISVVLSSIEETEEFFEVLAVDADPHVVLFCTKELFYELMTDEEGNSVRNSKLKRLDDIMARYGVFCDNYNYSEDRYYIALTDCVHSAGARILYAVRNNCTEILSDREQQTMEEAVALAQEIASGYVQPGTGNADGSGFSSQVWLDMAKTIHDRLCRRIRYTIDDDMTEDDNAIGALLNGEANCDGYSDAFYLVGNLAGLTVSFQIGDSINNIDGSQGDTSHIWNLLMLDGTWRMVDVTWDDCNDLELEYTWFNIGLDRAQRTHTWDRQISLQLLEKTDLSERPANEYSVNSLEEAFEAVHSAVRNYRYFAIYFEDEETRNNILSNCIVIYLKASEKTIFNRIKNTVNRPLLSDMSVEKINQIMSVRIANYEKAHIKIDTDNKTLYNIVKEIKECLKST